MAFVSCRKCGWEQDDFWDPNGYNPFKSLGGWKSELFGPNLDQPFSIDSEFINDHGMISHREFIAREFEKWAKKIRAMKWVTEEEYKAKNPTHLCPRCKEKLTVD